MREERDSGELVSIYGTHILKGAAAAEPIIPQITRAMFPSELRAVSHKFYGLRESLLREDHPLQFRTGTECAKQTGDTSVSPVKQPIDKDKSFQYQAMPPVGAGGLRPAVFAEGIICIFIETIRFFAYNGN